MELIKNYGTYILTGISIILTVISYLVKNRFNKNTKKIFNILSFLPSFINQAEKIFQLVNKSGADKLQFVLNKLQYLCVESGLNFDEDFWIKKIEDFLSVPQKK